MTEDALVPIREEIAKAYALAADQKPRLAVRSFARSRELVLEVIPTAEINSAVAREHANYKKEREVYRRLLRNRHTEGDKIVLFGDSLGLARPEEKTGVTLGCNLTYPWFITSARPPHQVDSVCQRFFTTDFVLAELEADPDLGRDASVIIHVGLNDCATRMFLERERIALALIPEDLRMQIVGFSQKHRRDIINYLPPHQYVPPARFRANLTKIAVILQERQARKIILTTIILPPAKSWPGTPGINRNFAAYNLEIMDAVQRHDLTLFDFDRHVWQAMHQDVLVEDGMHLSTAGHTLFAQKAMALLRQPAAPVPAA